MTRKKKKGFAVEQKILGGEGSSIKICKNDG